MKNPVLIPRGEIAERFATDVMDRIRQNHSMSLEERKLLRHCGEFEAVIVGHLFSSMRRAMAAEGGLFGDSPQSEIYRALFDDEVARSLSKSANLGVARLLYRQLSPLLDKSPKPGS